MPLERKRKVLVIRLSSLGDVVHSTSVVAPLTAAGCEVYYVTKAGFAPLLFGHPQIRGVYRYDTKKSGSEARARETFFSWVENQRFDFILDLHDSLRTRWWRRTLRRMAPIYVAKKERFREWLILFFRLKRTFSFGAGGRARKMRQLAFDALADQGLSVEASMDLSTVVALDPVAESRVAKLLPSKFAVLVPGSAWPGKEWPYYSGLATELGKRMPIVVLGGADDKSCDAVAEQALRANSESKALQGKTSLAESVAVIAKAALVIGNDTGLIQVAEALGLPTLVIEGPTEESLGFSVYKKSSRKVGLDLVCRPCSKTGRICWRFGKRTCMKELDVSRVLNDAREFL